MSLPLEVLDENCSHTSRERLKNLMENIESSKLYKKRKLERFYKDDVKDLNKKVSSKREKSTKTS